MLEFFKKRLDCVEYALACDDEANHHYKSQPSGWHRFKVSVIAFFFE
ncbi:TPA: hypothetical protein RQN23_000694 [Aeromonas veronii]|nr:hypothetical protein [Aeromonas veronii]